MRSRMFSLHETIQRRVCRVAFIALCVVPTIWTIAWIAYFYRPWRYDDWKRALTQQFHIGARVEGLESPRPGITKLARVAIADLRSQQPLGKIEALKIEHQGNRLALFAKRVELSFEQIQEFVKTLETCLSASELPSIVFRAEQVDILGAKHRQFTLRHFLLQDVRSEAGSQIRLQAVSSENDTKLLCQFGILTDPEKQRANQLRVAFTTQEAEIPAWVVAGLVPGVGNCDQATFAGKAEILNGPAGSRGQLEAKFSNLDLKQWIGPLSPHQAAGLANLKLQLLEWEPSGLKRVTGHLQVADGYVNHDLVAQLMGHVYCRQGEAYVSSSDFFAQQPFDEVSCRFEVTKTGITLTGTCQSVVSKPDLPGCLVAYQGKSLLLEPTYTDIPTSQLALALYPQANRVLLPLVSQALDFIRNLPVPSLQRQPAVPETAIRDEAGETERILR